MDQDSHLVTMAENNTPDIKGPITSITETSEALPLNTERPKPNLANAVWSIIWSVALPSVPILAVTIVLLRVIVKHRVIPNAEQGWPQLYLTSESSNIGSRNHFLDFVDHVRYNGAGPAYYVIYNPSTITTIASWTSRLIPYLSSSIMALVAFFVASHVVQKSQGGHVDQLPDPQQMTILISLLGGNGLRPMQDALAHSWKQKRLLVAPLPAAFVALFLITIIG